MFGRKESTKTEIDDSLLNSLKCIPIKVSLKLKILNPKESIVPYNIVNNILKMCHETLGKSLALIFQICINKDTYPICWKLSHVIPSFKERNKADVSN